MMLIDFPLYQVFKNLRKHNFPLTLKEYYDVLEILRMGNYVNKTTGIWDANGIMRVCKSIWFKPNQNIVTFEAVFNAYYLNKETTLEEPKPESEPSNILDKQRSQDSSDFPINTIEEQNDQNQRDSVNLLEEKEDSPFVKLVLGDGTGNKIEVTSPKKLSRRFLFTPSYFGVNKREMKQITRFLPLYHKTGHNNDIDISKTVDYFAQKGFLSKPIFKTNWNIANGVVILINNSKSMLAFENLTSQFEQAVRETFNKNTCHTYYFHDIIGKNLYYDLGHTLPINKTEVIEKLHRNSSVIFLSDADVVRETYSAETLTNIVRLLILINKKTDKIVWLNPMPKERWNSTTANNIKNIIPMYDLQSKPDLQKAFRKLRGIQLDS